jgi:hypothetical protein
VLAGAHDPHKRYDLVMRDAVTNIEVLRCPSKWIWPLATIFEN